MIKIIESKKDSCVGCNRCVRECPMEMANIAYQDESGNTKVKLDHGKCIVCGRCISACKHNSRYYTDDTERFFEDLKNGVSISLMAAPAIRTNIPEYKRLFTYLKRLGVKKIYDVSLGADICIWTYIRYMEKNNFKPVITQPCPSIVRYCEMYRHDLLDRLSPVQSPMACTSIYMKQYNGINDRIAALSPCIAKSVEFNETGLTQYNITFEKLLKYLNNNNIKLPNEETQFDSNNEYDECNMGALFPILGGLKENIEYFVGAKFNIIKGDGFNVYEKLNRYAEVSEDFLPSVFDVLNCDEGCVLGSACNHNQCTLGIGKVMDTKRRSAFEEGSRRYYESAHKKYDNTFDLSHFLRDYKRIPITLPNITDDDIEKAFLLLNKTDYEKQNIDCCACGSKTCHDMARKIAFNVNIPINCIVKDREDALESSHVKSAFLANMSHEIRTPMNAIIGMAEILENENLSERQMSYVNDISVSSHSLLGIINDILDLSKIESGKLELNPIDFNLLQLLDNVASMFVYIAKNKEIEFLLEVDENVPHYIFADDIRLKQILVNICSNAVKFTYTGYVKLTVKSLNRNLVIRVEDTGIGIRKEAIPKLFNAYEQTDKIKNREITGTGLGLSISKSFVEMMGGNIAVESEYGSGTVFTIAFPIVRVRSNPKNIQKSEYKKAEQNLSAPTSKILVTDDNEFNLKVSSGLLNIMDIKSETADSGFRAIELIKAKNYDVVFMDHMMPEMDGIETVKKIREMGGIYKDLPIIALTANATVGAKEIFLNCGFNDFISKPIDSGELAFLLKEWLPPEKVTLTTKETAKNVPNINPDLVRFFNQRLLSECKKMTDFLRSDNLHGFAVAIHAMKSSLAIIGETLLSNVAHELETAAKNGQLKYCREYYVRLEKRLKELHERLTVMFPNLPEKESPEKKESGNNSTLERLVKKAISAAEDFDGDVGVECLKSLSGFDFGKEINESVAQALTAFDDFDFDKAINILRSISHE